MKSPRSTGDRSRPDCAARRSHIGNMLPSRALPDGRLTAVSPQAPRGTESVRREAFRNRMGVAYAPEKTLATTRHVEQWPHVTNGR